MRQTCISFARRAVTIYLRALDGRRTAVYALRWVDARGEMGPWSGVPTAAEGRAVEAPRGAWRTHASARALPVVADHGTKPLGRGSE